MSASSSLDAPLPLQELSHRHTVPTTTIANMEQNIGGNHSRFDPFRLADRIKSEPEIEQASAPPHAPPRKHQALAGKGAAVRRFYENQNERIEQFLKPVDDHVRDARQAVQDNDLQRKIAVYGSFAANIVLSGLQLYGAIASGSLSLFTTMADSIFDPMSNLILIVCNRAAKKASDQKWPAGKARIETVGNVVFSFVMISVSALLIGFSVQELVKGGEASFHLPAVIAVSIAFVTKLGLFLYCWSLRNKYSQVRVLWEDHRNDLFINGFGILTSVGGSKLRWWIDPMGAIILSALIIILWSSTATGEFKQLIGVTASDDFLQLVTYIAVTHSNEFKAIDTVRAYHSGPKVVVEVDVVMDPDSDLRTCHDTAEELQGKLESLPDVERAYVHIDYEATHKPEHKKEL